MPSIYLPDNIFSRMLFSSFNDEVKRITKFKASASLSSEIRNDKSVLALIPVTDIITNEEFFISKLCGISFEGSLCNSYIYFSSAERDVSEIKFAGDVSTIEVILTKILFKELYNSEVEISLTTPEKLKGSNYIVAGDDNFLTGSFENGLSFAEQVVDLISAPFVNYVFASGDEALLKDYSQMFTEIVPVFDEKHLQKEIPLNSKNFINENFPKVFYKFDEQDIEGINQVTRLPYYHGLIKEIIDVKFV